MVGRLLSFWEGLFSGDMLVSGRVTPNFVSLRNALVHFIVLEKLDLISNEARGVFFFPRTRSSVLGILGDGKCGAIELITYKHF